MRHRTAAPSLFVVQAFAPSTIILSHRSFSSILPSYDSSIPRRRRTVVFAAAERSQNKKKNWWERIMGGGAYNLQIDYDALDFPAPQLAQQAVLGKPMSATTSIIGASEQSSPSSPPSHHLSVATFSGGCFWGVELAFQRIEGVAYTCVGYTQGREVRPNYEQVLAGNTGHTESVCVYFDPKIISYLELCQIFLHKILSDPTRVHGQGKDYGKQYRTGIYYHTDDDNDDHQKVLAHQALAKLASQWTRPIAVECRHAQPFWPAEAHHQRYLEKGGRYGSPQSAAKNCTDPIQCYG